MTRRTFAAALLLLATAACSDATLGGDQKLVGAWGSDAVTINVPLPNGSTHGSYDERYRFFGDGTFAHFVYYRDLDSNRTWTGVSEQGTWRVADGVLKATITRRFAAPPQGAHENPAEADVIPGELARYTYSFVGDDLLLGGWCPPNAICEILPRRLHPMMVAF